jgi:hypothetical protein
MAPLVRRAAKPKTLYVLAYKAGRLGDRACGAIAGRNLFARGHGVADSDEAARRLRLMRYSTLPAGVFRSHGSWRSSASPPGWCASPRPLGMTAPERLVEGSAPVGKQLRQCRVGIGRLADSVIADRLDELLHLRDAVDQLAAAELPQGFGRD